LESTPTPFRTGSLEERLAESWDLLQVAVDDPGHELHLPSIATIDADGHPRSRTVVLRGFDRERLTLRIHTDLRSPKCRDIESSPVASWHFYDRSCKLQLRLRTTATIHTDSPAANDAWASATATSRRAYLAPHQPSSPLKQWHPNIPDEYQRTVPPMAATEAGRPNFALIICEIQELDRLDLGYDGHRRSRWRWREGKFHSGEWLAA
jgi:pyridoxine/pyridoxamine 5'-phosphate oxidase